MSGNTDVFGRKHLSVLNRTGPSSPSHFLLEDAGLAADQPLPQGTTLEKAVIAMLKTIYDPEIPLNIYDLGLVYRVAADDLGQVEVDMSLTSPGCPVAGVLIRQAHDQVRRIPGVQWVRTELVWDPPWTKERMGDAAKLALGLL
jgi:FeS assembly SUF system protein